MAKISHFRLDRASADDEKNRDSVDRPLTTPETLMRFQDLRQIIGIL